MFQQVTKAVEKAGAVIQLQANRGVSADDGAEVERGVLAGKLQFYREESAKLLVDRRVDNQDLVGAERGVDRQRAVAL